MKHLTMQEVTEAYKKAGAGVEDGWEMRLYGYLNGHTYFYQPAPRMTPDEIFKELLKK